MKTDTLQIYQIICLHVAMGILHVALCRKPIHTPPFIITSQESYCPFGSTGMSIISNFLQFIKRCAENYNKLPRVELLSNTKEAITDIMNVLFNVPTCHQARRS